MLERVERVSNVRITVQLSIDDLSKLIFLLGTLDTTENLYALGNELTANTSVPQSHYINFNEEKNKFYFEEIPF